MTRAQFMKLKAGDVVVYNDKRLRTVQDGPGDAPGKAAFVTFAICRRSWTNRSFTVAHFHDVAALLKGPVRRTGLLALKSEIAALVGNGFDVRAELKRELDEAARVATECGKPLCRAFARLSRIAAGATP